MKSINSSYSEKNSVNILSESDREKMLFGHSKKVISAETEVMWTEKDYDSHNNFQVLHTLKVARLGQRLIYTKIAGSILADEMYTIAFKSISAIENAPEDALHYLLDNQWEAIERVKDICFALSEESQNHLPFEYSTEDIITEAEDILKYLSRYQ